MDNNNTQQSNVENQNNIANSNLGGQPPQVSSPQPSSPQPDKSRTKLVLIILAVLLVFIVILGIAGYIASNNILRAVNNNSTSLKVEQEKSKLTLPEGATVIAQCAKGRGTQYALPKDIPLGPVYNVHEGEVIGIEFMIGKDELLLESKNFLNLPLNNVKYNHINVGLLSEGHAGFTSPHYHVDVMMVPTSVTEQITCS